MRNTRRTNVAAVGLAGLLAFTGLAGCGSDEQAPTAASPTPSSDATGSASPSGGSGTPSTGTSTPDSTSPSTSGPTSTGTQTVPVYYVGKTPAGPRLYREFHRLAVGAGPRAVTKAALVEAVTDSAKDPDYRSPWARLGTTVGDVEVASGDAVVVDLAGDLHDRPAGMSRTEASMAVQQLVYTAQAALQRRAPVQLLLGGRHTDTLLGVPVSEPLAEGDPMRVQATVWVIDPQEGDEVRSPFTVQGRGAFFEATVSWQLLRDGKVVQDGTAMSKEGNTLAPYSFTVTAKPGDYVLRVYDADMSGGEGGGGEPQDTKRITVR